MKGTTIAAVLAVVLQVFSAQAASLPRFSESVPFPLFGLEFPMFQHAKQEAARPAEILRYRWTRGEETWTEERSDPLALWRLDQRMGVWRNQDGYEISIAAVTLFPPLDFPEKHVTEDAFLAWAAAEESAMPETVSAEQLRTWADAYEPNGVGGNPVVRQGMNHRIQVAEFPALDSGTGIWMFRIDSRVAGQSGHPRNWFYVRITRPEAISSCDETFRRIIKNDFWGGIRVIPVTDGGLAAASGGGNRDVAPGDPQRRWRPSDRGRNYRDDLERRRGRSSISNQLNWWYMESENYILLSDDPAAERIADRMLDELESLRSCFMAQVPFFETAEPMTGVVRLFRTDEDFQLYLQDGGLPLSLRETAGLFDGGRRELVIRPIAKSSVQTRMNVIRHEAFHQYLFQATSGCLTSPWFNEGTAEYFSGFEMRSQRWTMTELRHSAKILESLARDRNVDWEKLLESFLFWDYERFYRPGKNVQGGVSFSYAFGYGLMHFLYRGAPALRNQPYRDLLPTYLAVLEETHNPSEAVREAFRIGRNKDEFLRRFVRDFRAYWLKSSEREAGSRRPILQ